MPAEMYPAGSDMPSGSRSSAHSEPVTDQDTQLSAEHKDEALKYNLQHARDHMKVAAGIEAGMGDERAEGYPEYGFYGPGTPSTTVADEGEVANGVAQGFSQNSRDKWIRTVQEEI